MISNAGDIAKSAWSMWAFYLLMILQSMYLAAQQMAPELQPSPFFMGVLVLAISFVGGILRLISQPALSPTEPE